jgi:hypothetical protein
MATSNGVTFTAAEINILAAEHPYLVGIVLNIRATGKPVSVRALALEWGAKERHVESAAFRAAFWGLVSMESFSADSVAPF